MASKNAGPPPDYKGAAQAQGASGVTNIGTQTQSNRPDQTNAFGVSTNWSRDPTTGNWNQSVNFGNELGGLYDNLLGNEKAAAAQGPLDFSKLGPLGDGSRASDAAYSQEKSRLDPQFAQRDEQLKAELANEGLDPNSEAYRRAEENFGRERTDAYQTAQNFAQQQGIAQQQQDLARRGQLAGEMVQSRAMPMQQLAALLGFTGMPQFMGAGAAGPTPYLGAAQALGNFQLGNADQQNKTMAGVGQLFGDIGGAAIAASDERVKSDVRRSRTREVLPDVPEATFRYKGSKQKMRGVIAQDVEKAGYKHLVRDVGGVKHVVGGRLRPRPFSMAG